MCHRFSDPDQRYLNMDLSRVQRKPARRRYNIKPTEPIYVVRAGGELEMARWGLIPSTHKGDARSWRYATFNARIEGARTAPSYAGPWLHGRCLIPAGGYYEWTGDEPPKQPHFFSSAGNEATLWFAGLTSTWQDTLTATIMTRAANECVEPLHNRMPVILDVVEREAWLGGSTDLTIGAGARVKHHPVRRFGMQEDGERLIEPAE